MKNVLFILVSLLMPLFSPAESIPTPAYAADWCSYPEISVDYERLARRVHIPSTLLRDNPDLALFLQANYLHKHLSYHGHALRVDDQQEVLLLYQNKEIAWTTLRCLLHLDEEGIMQDHVYTHEGLVPCKPGRGLPVFTQTQRHAGRFVVEVLSNSRCVPAVKRRQAHVWLRLIDNEGAVISSGYFGDRPITSFWEMIRHLYPRTARILSPDLFEVLTPSRNLRITAIQLNELQYHQLLSAIAEAQEEENRSYQILDTFYGQNCAGFVLHILSAAGITVPKAARLNLPSRVIGWQEKVESWRTSQLEQLLLETERPSPEEVNAIRYGLP